MGVIAAGKTDIGRKRKTNQDAIYLNNQYFFFMVADGMGGHQGGDIASQMAAKLVPEFLVPKLSGLSDNEEVSKTLADSVKHANLEIFKYSKQNEMLKGMGTTVVTLLFSGSSLYVANVGDSRAYLIHKGQLFQLSRDHSLVQEKVYMGLYTREQGAQDKMKNVLVRTVGFEDQVEVDLFTYKVHRNDMFLLCSDGLHGKVSDHDMLHIINQHLPQPANATQEQVNKAVETLIEQANQNGGQDNISVVLAVTQ